MARTPHVCSIDERESGCPVCLDDELREARLDAEDENESDGDDDPVVTTQGCSLARLWRSVVAELERSDYPEEDLEEEDEDEE